MNKRRKLGRRGMTLLEVVFSLGIFILVSIGIIGMTIQSKRALESAVIRNGVYSAARAYLDQIKRIPNGQIRAVMASPSTPLQIQSLDVATGQVVSDTLLINQYNVKTITLQMSGDTKTGQAIQMGIQIRPSFVDWTGSNMAAIAVTLDFQYTVKYLMVSMQRSGQLVYVKADI